MCDFVTIIIPLFLVTDTNFIKIFAGKYVEKRLPGVHETLLGDSPDMKITQKNIGMRESTNPVNLKNQAQIQAPDQVPATQSDLSLLNNNTSEVQDLVNEDHNNVIDTPPLREEKVEAYRTVLELNLKLEETDFAKGEPFERPWYPKENKFLKSKLGQLVSCTFKEEKREHLCRVLEFDR